MEIFNQTENK